MQVIESSGVHGLACRKSAGRHMRHNAVDDLIKRALASANVPSVLEPIALSRDNGKRPEDLTVQPGRCMICDFTCTDTLASGHLNRSVLSAGAASVKFKPGVQQCV